ncbi:MAG: glutathione S-transferase family protein [Thalassotalea sp.]|nr:glutathione S-transferase family protein [Thalassotalea sp.]
MTKHFDTQSQENRQIEIFGPSFSNFVRSIMLLCEEKNIEYTTGLNFAGETIDFKSEQHFNLHPFGKFPIIKHQTLILSETASICRYIQSTFVDNASALFSPQQSARIDAFSAIISIYIDKALVRDYLLEFAFPKGDKGEVRFDVVKEMQKPALEALMSIENELTHSDTLNNEHLSIADVLIAPILHYVSVLPSPFNLVVDFPNIQDYLLRLMRRESFKKVLVAPRNW